MVALSLGARWLHEDEGSQVRVRASTLVVAAAIEVLGVGANAAATFLQKRAPSSVSWFIPVAAAVILSVVTTLVDAARSSSAVGGEVTSLSASNRGRRGLASVVAALVAVVLVIGLVGVALTGAVRYGAGWVTGKEDGPDYLAHPVTKSGQGLRITVEHLRRTTHFMRADLTVRNTGSSTTSLPIYGYTVLVAQDGTALDGDSFRSQWHESFPPGVLERGTITFSGHLPKTAGSASLSFTTVFVQGPGGGGAITLRLPLRAPA